MSEEKIENKVTKFKGHIQAIPDLLNSYNKIIECYTELFKDEKGKYGCDWLKKEADSLKDMAWKLARGSNNE